MSNMDAKTSLCLSLYLSRIDSAVQYRLAIGSPLTLVTLYCDIHDLENIA